MSLMDDAWPGAAKAFHWGTALLVLAQLPLGWIAKRWPLSPLKLDLFLWHKSIGFVILLLVVARVAYRSSVRRPPWSTSMAIWERASAQVVHVLLYAVLVAMPLSGWVINSASNVPFRMFRIVPVPAITAPDKAVANLASRIHFALFVVLSVLLALHVGAALWHHFARRDGVLNRMLPGRTSA